MKPRRASYLLRAGEAYLIMPPRIAALIESRTNVKALRVKLRGIDPEATAVLEDLRVAALSWRSCPDTTTGVDRARKPAARSSRLTTGQAAELAKVTRQAIGKAIRTGHLTAIKINGRYHIERPDLDQWRSSRPR
jgi:excisionase family DNA binding protein